MPWWGVIEAGRVRAQGGDASRSTFSFFQHPGGRFVFVRSVGARSYGGHTSSGPMRSQNRHFGVSGSAFGGNSEILSSGSLPSATFRRQRRTGTLAVGRYAAAVRTWAAAPTGALAVGRYAAPVHASSHSPAAYVFQRSRFGRPPISALLLCRAAPAACGWSGLDRQHRQCLAGVWWFCPHPRSGPVVLVSPNQV